MLSSDLPNWANGRGTCWTRTIDATTNYVFFKEIENYCKDTNKWRAAGLATPTPNEFQANNNFPYTEELTVDLWNLGYVGREKEFPRLKKLIIHLNYPERDAIPQWCPIYIKEAIEKALKELPESIGNLENLEELVVINKKNNFFSEINSLEKLPQSLGKLKKLRKIDLSYNTYCKYCMDNKRYNLDCDGIGLKELPLSIINLKNLEELNLRGNNDLYRYKKMPKEIENFLGNLRELYLPIRMSVYQFKYPSNGLDLYHDEKYENMVSEGEREKGIPVDIFMISELMYLNASNGNVDRIPQSLSRLAKLKKLDLRNNFHLEKLPNFLWKMPSLKKVKINSNLLKYVPNNVRISSKHLEKTLNIFKIKHILLARRNNEMWSQKKFLKFLGFCECTVQL